MASDKLYSREYVQLIFCTKDALGQLNKALSLLSEFKSELNSKQEIDGIRRHIKLYGQTIATLSKNVDEMKILADKLD